MNIKIGDSVVQLGFDYAKIKQVKEVKPQTISLCNYYEGVAIDLEPKQNPAMWRLYDAQKVTQLEEILGQVSQLRRQVVELYRSLPKIELT